VNRARATNTTANKIYERRPRQKIRRCTENKERGRQGEEAGEDTNVWEMRSVEESRCNTRQQDREAAATCKRLRGGPNEHAASMQWVRGTAHRCRPPTAQSSGRERPNGPSKGTWDGHVTDTRQACKRDQKTRRKKTPVRQIWRPWQVGLETIPGLRIHTE
jgi:hypothetical protein